MRDTWIVTNLTNPAIRVPAHNLGKALEYVQSKKGHVTLMDYRRQEIVYSDFPPKGTATREIYIPPIPRAIIFKNGG